MSEIDLNKAPAGATHYRADSASPWRMLEDGEWYAWESDEENWISIVDPQPDRYMPICNGPFTWDGTGLPPIGTVCEIWDDSPHEYYAKHVGKTITVLAHDVMYGDPVAVYAINTKKGRKYHALVAQCFRPLRSHEQIAAEEREKAVAAIKAIADAAIYRGESAAAAVYDAGYRKVEGDKPC